MAKFITGEELNKAVFRIIEEADEELLIVSPYIKLGVEFQQQFRKHLQNHKLHVAVVFGKNENDAGKSLSVADIDFFKTFPNITIVYVANLHAKYYGNDIEGVITSINLYDYSFKHNVEYGVHSLTGLFRSNSNDEAWNRSWELVETGQVIFARRPVYKRRFIGRNEYLTSRTCCDNSEVLYNRAKLQTGATKFADLPEELFEEDSEMSVASIQQTNMGFCIRTGIEIPYNPARPFCAEAYKSWAVYKNADYREKFCHKTGIPSNGKTSFRKPILSDYE